MPSLRIHDNHRIQPQIDSSFSSIHISIHPSSPKRDRCSPIVPDLALPTVWGESLTAHLLFLAGQLSFPSHPSRAILFQGSSRLSEAHYLLNTYLHLIASAPVPRCDEMGSEVSEERPEGQERSKFLANAETAFELRTKEAIRGLSPVGLYVVSFRVLEVETYVLQMDEW